MNKQEFAILASAIRTYYPKEKILPNQQSMQLWFLHLQDIPYKVAEIALERWVIKNKWSPTIADLREAVKGVYWANLENQTGEEFYNTYTALKMMEHSEEKLPEFKIGGEHEQIQDTLAYKTIL